MSSPIPKGSPKTTGDAQPPESPGSRVDSGNRRLRGFTLTELLVVLGIVAVLAGLVIPGLAQARFRSRVAGCSNQYRQWGIAANVYAADDGRGRLPSYALPVDRMTTYSSIEPWFVAIEMITNLSRFGVNTPMWFCPVRPIPFQVHRDNFRALRGRELTTPEDLVDEYVHVQRAAFAFPDLFWWVPRRLGTSALEFPDPARMTTRVPESWPRRIDDPTVSRLPILSDWALGEWDDDRRNVRITGGGHAWPTRFGPVKSANAGYADGHVETHPRKSLQWQAEGRRSMVYVY